MSVDDRFSDDYRENQDRLPRSTRSEVISGPVADWAADFSHVDRSKGRK